MPSGGRGTCGRRHVLQVIISKFNEIDANHYLDPRSNQTFQFDHVRQVASELQPSGQATDPTRCVPSLALNNLGRAHNAHQKAS